MKSFARSTAAVLLATVLCCPVSAQVAAPANQAASVAGVSVEPALDGLFRAFGSHPVVALGDPHGLAEQMEFYAAVVRDPRFARDVRNLVVEFGASSQQAVIDRYVALVNPEAVGLGLTAYLNVRLEKHTESHKRNPMDLFRASVQTWPEVVECAALTGDMDYLLRVVVQDMAHYSRFIMDTLLKHPSVEDCKTSFVLDRVKATTAIPV